MEFNCRTCLKTTKVYYDLFSNITISENVLKLSTLITNIAEVQIDQEDTFPQIICGTCFSRLINAYDFKVQCEQSYQQLLENATYSEEYVVFEEEPINDEEDVVDALEDTNTTDRMKVDSNEVVEVAQVYGRNLNIIKVHPVNESKSNPEDLDESINPNTVTTTSPTDEARPRIHKRRPQIIIGDDKQKIIALSKKPKTEKYTKINGLYVCEICEASFSTKRGFSVHRRCHRKPKTAYVCHYPECGGIKFKFKSWLDKHLAIHADLKTHSCAVCGKRFNTRDALVHHRRYHAEPAYTCTICERKFYFSFHLKCHLVNHTGEKYKCETCGGDFANPWTLKKHRRMYCGSGIMPKIIRKDDVRDVVIKDDASQSTDSMTEIIPN